GGNALGNNPEEQSRLVKHTAISLVDLIEEGHTVVVVHGNGPQVGMINAAFGEAHLGFEMPFAECGAMSEGYIGYHLQNAIKSELLLRHLPQEVVCLITQVIVDSNDPAFLHPTKPIGSFVSLEEATILAKTHGYQMKEDSGRGYRRVIASPKPLDVVEKHSIQALIQDGSIVISCGGGGIPVIEENGELNGIAAVIDKDFAAAKLAQLIDADCLLILTAVEQVMLQYNTPQQRALDTITVAQAKAFIEAKEFGEGSMLPKIEATVDFVDGHPERMAIIASLEQAKAAIALQSGTRIVC
ncbi:MAG: carbamate kinase, partial [Erysipelotrichaceae bacterium]